ncbi:hypothetical protein Dimus_006946 [Dionaea muscipula]
MGSFTKLGIIFTSLSSLFFLAVFAEILYVLYRRFHRRPSPFTADGIVIEFGFAGNDDDRPPHCVSQDHFIHYFPCWKKRCRIEPTGATATRLVDASPDITIEPSELMKLQGIYRASRVLFTIKEEEKDDLGSSLTCSSDEMRTADSVVVEVLCEPIEVVGDSCPDLNVVMEGFEGFEIPFESPCGSPPYYTPPTSPSRLD